MSQVQRPSRILVVDDDQQLCDLLTEILAEAGYTVQCAHDGESAWIEVLAHSPDLVLSDITMPRLDGVGLARRLTEAGFRMPIILMSARPHVGAAVSDAFVSKPFDLTNLLVCIARVLEETNTVNARDPR
jgi:DNA-binding response OmpR family regulator